MTDSHLRILRLVAQKRQRQLSDHDAVDHTGHSAAAARRRRLKLIATRSRKRFVEAEARRLAT